MKYTFISLLTFFGLIVNAQNFTPGNVVVTRVGDGSTTLSTNNFGVNLLEFNTNTANQASPTKTVAIGSTTAGSRITVGGTVTTEGQLSLSQDRRYLNIIGYDATLGSTSATYLASSINRTIGRIDYTGTIDYSTNVTGATTSSKLAATIDGNAYYTAIGGTVGYITQGATSAATTIATLSHRVLNIYKNQLYSYAGFSNITASNTALPTGTSAFSTAVSLSPSLSALGFVYFDVDPTINWNGTGYDLLYVSNANSGLEKYYYNGTNWIPANAQYQSLTIANGGTGYSGSPTVAIGTAWQSGGTYTVNQQVYNGVSLYTVSAISTGISGATPPTHTTGSVVSGGVTFTYSGTNATATVSVSGGVVTAGFITYGSGVYLSLPSVTLTGGGGSGASVTCNVAYVPTALNNGTGALAQLTGALNGSGIPVIYAVTGSSGTATNNKLYSIVDNSGRTGIMTNANTTATVLATAGANYAFRGVAFAPSVVTWTGTTNTDWNTASNWSNNKVPDSSVNVIIPSGITNYPSIATGSTANNVSCLTVNAGATLTINDNAVLYTTGSVTVNGLVAGNGNVLNSDLSPYSFTKGNLVVSQVDISGLSANTNSGQVSLVEYTIAGVRTRKPAMKLNATSGYNRLVISGTATSNTEGQLALSGDGRYITLAGYDTVTNIANTDFQKKDKVIGRVAYNSAIPNLATKIATSESGSAWNGTTAVKVVTAVTNDGNEYWVLGNQNESIRFIPHYNATQTASVRVNSVASATYGSLGLFGGKLFTSFSFPSVSQFNMYSFALNRPTALSTNAGFINTTVSAGTTLNQFVFFDVQTGGDPATGYDLMYMNDVNGSLIKFYNDGIGWARMGTFGSAASSPFTKHGLTGTIVAGQPVLYFIRGADQATSYIMKVTDNTAYNAAVSGLTATVVATSPANTVFKGLAFVPYISRWTGAVSTDWNTASNWSPAVVPDSTTSVVIPNNLANYPSIATNVTTNVVYSLDVTSGATITLNSGVVFRVKGALNNNGTITGAGKVYLKDVGFQPIVGTTSTISNVDLDNTEGATTLNTVSTHTTTGTLTLTSGTLAVNNSTLAFHTGNTPIAVTAGKLALTTTSNLEFGTAGNLGGSAFTIPNDVFSGTAPAGPSFNNLTVNRANSITLGNQDITVNGTAALTSGVLDASGRTLTFQNGNTPLSTATGTLTLSSTSNLIFGTTGNLGGNAVTIPNGVFTSDPSITNLTVNRTNALTLGNQDLTISGALTLTNGVLNASGRTLTFHTGATPIVRNGTTSVGTLTLSNTSNLIFGTSGNIGGAAFTLPNSMFTSAPTINNFTLNRTNNLTLGNQDLTVNGSLTLTAGVLVASGKNLIFQNGDVPIVRDGTTSTGTITVSSTSNLTFGTAGNVGGAAFTLPSGTFTGTTTSVNSLNINRTNSLTLGQDLIVNAGGLALTSGVFNINSRVLTLQTANVPITRTSGTLTVNTSTAISFGATGNTGGNAFTLPDNVFTAATPAFFNLSINRANDLILGNQNITLTRVTLTAGVLDASNRTITFGNTSTPLVTTGGTLKVNSGTSLSFGGGSGDNNAQINIPNNFFTSTPSLNNFTVNRVNPIALGNQDMIINGSLILTRGAFDVNGRTLTFQNGNTPITRNGTTSIGTLTVGSTSNLAFGSVGNVDGDAFTLPNSVFTATPSINDLTINRTNPITIGNQAFTVNGTLTLTSGVIALGSNNLTLPNTATVSGANTAGYVDASGTGRLIRNSVGNTATLFPVGTAASYAPLTITNTTGTSNLSVGVQPTITNAIGDPTQQVNLEWSVLGSSQTTATIQYQFNGSDAASGFLTNTKCEIGNFKSNYGVTQCSNNGTGIPAGSDPYTISAIGFVIPNSGTNYYVVANTGNVVITSTTWTGTVSSAWGTSANWSDGVPSATISAIVGTALRQPINTTAQTVKSLTVNSGITITNNSTIDVKSTLTNNGTISGTGTTILSGSANQAISGVGTVSNFTVNNTNGATVTSGANKLNVTGTLTLKSGTLTTNGNVVLKSTSITNSAVVAPIGTGGNSGSISGNVTVERFIPKGFRAWRDFGASVYNAGTIYTNWQEGGSYANSGYGVFITGTTASTASHGVDATTGLDQTVNSLKSAYTLTGGAWSPITNTKFTNLNPFLGYRLLVRGDRTFNLFTTPISTVGTTGFLLMNSATALRATGKLVTGNVVFSTSGVTNAVSGATYSSAAFGLNGTTTDGFSSIANPYVAPIDWKNIYDNGRLVNLTPSYYYLDPTIGSTGAYVAYNALTDVASNLAAGARYIQAGQAVFVQNNASTSPSLTITEADKAITSTKTSVFGAAEKRSKLAITLMKQDNADWKKMDMSGVVFDNRFSNELRSEDALKMTNAGENLSIVNNNQLLSIEGRQPAQPADVLPLSLEKMTTSSYALNIDASAYSTGDVAPYLVDAYTNTTTALNLNENIIPFTTDNAVAASYANRFSIVFKAKTANTSGAVANTIASYSLYPNPAVSKAVNIAFENVVAGKYTVTIYNSLGQKVHTQTISHAGGAAAHSLGIRQVLAKGVYYVTVGTVSGNKVVYNTNLSVE